MADGQLVGSRALDMERGQAESLMPLLEELLAQSGSNGWSDIHLIGCGTGPGNFTGTRISVAAARALALALKIPAIGVSVLEAAAYGRPLPCLVALDARRGESYVQRFGAGSTEPALMPAGAALPVEGTLCQIGNADSLASNPETIALPPPQELCHAIAQIAERLSAREQPRPAPLYLRAADAAPPREPPPVILP